MLRFGVLVISLVLLRRATLAYLSNPIPRRDVACTSLLSSSHRHDSGNSGGGSGSINRRRPLTAAEQERRDEDRRRQERKNDVIPGKTSALEGAEDFALDPQATEEAWMRQASALEREVFLTTERGIRHLKMMRIDEADEAFDRVYTIKPDAYLWQAGIVKFYKNRLMDAAAIFARNAAAYEQKFDEVASEERLWRDACELKLMHSLSRKERKRAEAENAFRHVPQCEEESEDLLQETRPVVWIAKEMFHAALRKDHINELLSRARLYAMCSKLDGRGAADRKMRKITSWYYLGLYYDVTKRHQESKDCMKMAIRLSPGSHMGNDIIHTLPMLHMANRDWFDNEEFDSNALHDWISDDSRVSSQPHPHLNPLAIASIEEGIARLRLHHLRDIMRQTGMKIVGEKEDLQERLQEYLIEQLKAGFNNLSS